jgi:hypothetical protein
LDVRLVGHGHPAIRATHPKTLELTPDEDITQRATCVVAVALEPAASPLAGPVRITLCAGDESFAFEARANSSWNPTDTAVIRRSPMRLPGTFATHASAAASDLPQSLIDALKRLETVVELDVEPLPGQPCAVLFAVDPHRAGDPRLRAEIAAADLVVAEDEIAARLVGERVASGPVSIDGRVLVLAARDLPGQTVTAALDRIEVETVGLPPALAAAAASPSRAPLLIAPDGSDLRRTVRDAPANVRLVVATPADEATALLALGLELRGTDGAVVVQEHAMPVRVRAGTPFDLASNETAYICFDAARADDALDPRVRTAIADLLADGVPTKTVAKSLATLTGWDRRRAYDAVLNWPRPT